MKRWGRESYAIAKGSPEKMAIFIRDWSLKMDDDVIHISIKSNHHDFKLQLKPNKPMVLHGDNGYSQKSNNKDRFSYYYSFTRLIGSGTYSNQHSTYTFKSASAWMDREIFNTLLDKEQIGWDWFAIQLDNGDDIMVFQVRSDQRPYFSGTYVKTGQEPIALSGDDFTFNTITFLDQPK